MQPLYEPISASSLSEVQRQEVLAQLQLVLASSLFRQSKRYPAFLRYVVESTLRGGDEQIKERTIGMEVFGRQPQYDTSQDPTVRLTAAEVRKRLAQYYQQPENALQLHIDLQPGSYIPTFSWPMGGFNSGERPDALPLGATAFSLVESASAGEPPMVPQKSTRSLLQLMAWVAVAATVLVCLFIFLYAHPRASEARGVWAPLLRDPNPISIVLPDISKAELLPQSQESATTSVLSHIRDNRLVDFNDSVALAKLSGMLGGWNKQYSVLLSSEATFEDLQRGPDILIGAADNPWTMRFLHTMHYVVVRTGSVISLDAAGKKPGAKQDWSIDLDQPFSQVQQDFGVIARQTDTMTGRPVLIVAGLGQNGTAAGIQMLTDPELERTITAAAPKGWSGRNFEVVYRTQIINDKFGPPVIVASEYW